MRIKLIISALAALVAGMSNQAMAQYVCPPGYAYYGGVCQPMGSPGYSNPVSGEAAGAASGYRAAGPVGAVVASSLGTAAGTLSGTAVRPLCRRALPCHLAALSSYLWDHARPASRHLSINTHPAM